MSKWKRFLERAYWTLDGWRFQDLKNFVSTEIRSQNNVKGGNDTTLTMMALHELANGQRNSKALISIMPPTESGVAVCNAKTLIEGGYKGDVFADWQSSTDWLNLAVLDRPRHLRGYSVHSLPFFLADRRYQDLVGSFGNSDADFKIVDILVKCQPRRFCARFAIHLHDVCLWNLCGHLAIAQGISLSALILKHYPEANSQAIARIFSKETTNNQVSEALIKEGLYGVKPILDHLDPTTVFVNSQAAIDILEEEYALYPRSFEVIKSFHPIFKGDLRTSEKRPEWNGSEKLRIGNFGILSGAKRSELVFEACAHLANRGYAIELVLAGFGTQQYLAKHHSAVKAYEMEVHDSPDDQSLLKIMDTVHVAVQLRDRNLGESSGVVASLIAKSVATVVSEIGSFAEYEGAAMAIDARCDATLLADAILKAANTSFSEAQKKYMEKHLSDQLCQLWFPENSSSAKAQLHLAVA